MSSWLVLRSGAGAAAWNMALDEALLEAVQGLGSPVLRFYSWTEPAATFGYSQRYHDVESWTGLRPLIRRITGGGLVPHDADWTYSLVFPPAHPWYALRADESYRRLHEWVAEAFSSLRVSAELSACCQKTMPGQCFAGAEKFDVLAGGRKIAGAAQKRNKLGLLIQGSVQPGEQLLSRAAWEKEMLAHANRAWAEIQPASSILERAARLAEEKYSRAEHNLRRW